MMARTTAVRTTVALTLVAPTPTTAVHPPVALTPAALAPTMTDMLLPLRQLLLARAPKPRCMFLHVHFLLYPELTRETTLVR
jgi:hypothetical protein